MDIDILIDDFTPCLEEIATGKIMPTTFALATQNDIKNLDDWIFDWKAKDLHAPHVHIYKLLTKEDGVLQGLVATESIRGSVYYVASEI